MTGSVGGSGGPLEWSRAYVGAWSPLFYGVAVLVATSRVHVQVHHASDVIVGAALGAVFARVAIRQWPLPPRP